MNLHRPGVLKDPPVIILDEATSSVDNETEATIQRSLDVIARGCTTILIAHRPSTVRNAHRIVVIDRGRIVESGTHQELIARDGLYASLWRVQTGSLISHRVTSPSSTQRPISAPQRRLRG